MESSFLIIDPDHHAAQITGVILSRLAPQASVKIVARPQEGWTLMQERWPELLLIDPSPEQSAALNLIQQARTAEQHTRIVAIASAPTPPLRRYMQQLDVDLYFEKPLLLPLCLSELRVLLNRQDTPASVTLPLAELPEGTTFTGCSGDSDRRSNSRIWYSKI